jgi:hypothetical protein
MSKQKNKKVAVKLKNVRICKNSPHLAEWIYKGKHQKWLSKKDLIRLQNGEKLRMMTIHAPKHTTATLAKKRLTKQ